MTIQWNVKEVNIKELKPYSKNPRQIHASQHQQLTNSLEKFGQCQPIVVNQDMEIIGGHQRIKSMKKIGLKTATVMMPEVQLDEKQVEELNIRLNRNLGEWDFDILANAFELPELIDWGFTAEELLDPYTEEKDEKSKKSKKEKDKKCPNCGFDISK